MAQQNASGDELERYTGFSHETPWDDDVPTIEVPAYYYRELVEREKMARGCPIKVFTSSISDRWGWPYKLQSVYKAWTAGPRSCGEYMVDSGYAKYGRTKDVLHVAEKYNARYLFASDVTPKAAEKLNENESGDQRHHTYSTKDSVDSIRYFIRRFQERDLDAELIVPIALPYEYHLEELAEEIEAADYVAVGALQALDTVDERINALLDIHEAVGLDTKIHALAPGTDLRMVKFLRENPDVITSLDVSTPENSVSNNKLPDKTWTQRYHNFPTGDDSTTVRAHFASSVAVQLAYMLNEDLCDDEVFEDAFVYQDVLPSEEIVDRVVEVMG